ncbi:MAG: glycosyltransferase [Gemmatimonadales bacterium]
MKIVHLLGWYFPESVGGTEVYVSGLAAEQRGKGHEVTVVAPIAGAPRALRYEHEGIDVFRYPTPVRPSRAEAQGRTDVSGTSHLHEFFSRLKPDIAHFHTITTGLGIDEMIAAKHGGARVVMTSHLPATGYVCLRGTLMRWGESLCDGLALPVKCGACVLQQRHLSKPAAWSIGWLGSLPGAKSLVTDGRVGTGLGMTDLVRFRIGLQRKMMETVDRFVLLNKASLEIALINGAPQEKLALNYLGHSGTAIAQKPSPSERPTTRPLLIGYVGRLAEGKGIREMLSAIESLPADLPIRFEFRGAANNSEGRALAQDIGAIAAKRDAVRLEPPVSPDLVAGVIATYDALCVPSSSFENGPTVVSEAHSVGTPVIGTEIGAMPEIIRSGISGLLVAPGKPAALSDAFRRIVEDPAGTIDKWRSNLPHARTMHEIATDYEIMYGEIASETHAHA